MNSTTTHSQDVYSLFADAIHEVAGKTVSGLRAEQPIAELGLDSIAVMEMVGTLEERLSLHFSDDELTKINTFGDLAALVQKYQAQALKKSA